MLKNELAERKNKFDEEIIHLTNSYEIKICEYEETLHKNEQQIRYLNQEIKKLEELRRDNSALIDSLQYSLNSLESERGLLLNSNKDIKRDLEKLKT